MLFSEYLQNYREEHNLSKKEMAKKLELTPMYYGRFENNNIVPTKHNIKRFSEKLSIPLSELNVFIDSKEDI